MTAAERLLTLAGTTGTAAALLLAIGTGATAGAALVDYSGLSTGTAAEHILVDHVSEQPPPASVGWESFSRPGRAKAGIVIAKSVAVAVEAERAAADPVLVLSSQAAANETEQGMAHAVLTQSAHAGDHVYSQSVASGRSTLDWSRINALDEEAFTLLF